jgi:hypothetical protein
VDLQSSLRSHLQSLVWSKDPVSTREENASLDRQGARAHDAQRTAQLWSDFIFIFEAFRYIQQTINSSMGCEMRDVRYGPMALVNFRVRDPEIPK